jgi:hypothetical protein
MFAQYMTKEPIELEANLYVQNWLMYKKKWSKNKIGQQKKSKKRTYNFFYDKTLKAFGFSFYISHPIFKVYYNFDHF